MGGGYGGWESGRDEGDGVGGGRGDEGGGEGKGKREGESVVRKGTEGERAGLFTCANGSWVDERGAGSEF